jgi:hypothetical protein
MEPKGSLPYARAPATCPYPEQPATWSILRHINRVHVSPPHFFTSHFNIILLSTPRSSKISNTQHKKLRTKTQIKSITLTQRSCHGPGKLVAVLSPRRPGFDRPRPVHRGVWLTKWQRDRVFFKYDLIFPLLVSFHQRSNPTHLPPTPYYLTNLQSC